jgi:hypothetical protein
LATNLIASINGDIFESIRILFDAPYTLTGGIKYAIVFDLDDNGTTYNILVKNNTPVSVGSFVESATENSLIDSTLAALYPDDDELVGLYLTVITDSGDVFANVTAYVASTGTLTIDEWVDELGETADAPNIGDEYSGIIKNGNVGLFWNYLYNEETEEYYWESDSSIIALFEVFFATTLPEKPINPAPEDEEKKVAITTPNLTWESGAGTQPAGETYDVYFGETSGSLELAEVGVATPTLEMPPAGYLDYSKNYYWRVDAVNEAGTTTGDEWTFDTPVNPITYERYPNYNSNLNWLYTDGEYQWADIYTSGGGRYNLRLVAIGHNTVYFS